LFGTNLLNLIHIPDAPISPQADCARIVPASPLEGLGNSGDWSPSPEAVPGLDEGILNKGGGATKIHCWRCAETARLRTGKRLLIVSRCQNSKASTKTRNKEKIIKRFEGYMEALGMGYNEWRLW